MNEINKGEINMSDKDFCTKLLLMAKDLNNLAENVVENDDQYDACSYITDKIIKEYEQYKMKHNV